MSHKICYDSFANAIIKYIESIMEIERLLREVLNSKMQIKSIHYANMLIETFVSDLLNTHSYTHIDNVHIVMIVYVQCYEKNNKKKCSGIIWKW